MIYYNSNTINGWNFGDDNIIKVYRNNAVCYYKITGGGDTPTAQTPCYAVVNDISQYSYTEFEDVFNKADEKWYKLNNLNQYEEYGVYGSGRNITYYDGKLTIDGDYEYQYSGGSWVNLGEVSGGTATLPNVPFVLNYNAKNYDATTHTIPMTSGQLNDTDAVAYNNPSNIVDHSADGYITISNSSMQIRKSGQDISLFNRTNTSTGASITIVCKAKSTSGENIITNRDFNYNWMYRLKTSGQLRFHGTSETGSIAWNISNPDIMSVRTYYDSGTKVYYNNWTQNTSTSPISFTYGSTNSDSSNAGALFVGYSWNSTNEQWSGDFYWVYMSQNTLTDEQVQQVIAYNEGGGGEPEYPIYYDEIQDPPNNVSFSSMTEAEAYECPWVGMTADIDNTDYIFDENYVWATKFGLFEVSGDYICDNGDKYQKMEEKVRNVDDTWSSQDPPVYEKGELIESASTDCQQIDYSKEYLTFVAETDNVSIGLYNAGSNVLQYSLDDGSTWNNIANNQTTPSINSGDKILFKASSLSVATETGIGRLIPSTSASVEGNIMSLAYGDNFIGQTVIPNNYQFRKLFSGATNITSSENMVIPATTLKQQCYSQMFQGCTSLTETPKTIGSSAMTWSGNYCMSNMFTNCTSLTHVSSTLLPALNLGTQCYWYMFERDTSLLESPILPATTLAIQCYQGLFNGCTNLNTITCLAASPGNTNYWVEGVQTVSGTFYKNPNATWSRGNNAVPNNWTIVDYSLGPQV